MLLYTVWIPKQLKMIGVCNLRFTLWDTSVFISPWGKVMEKKQKRDDGSSYEATYCCVKK